MDKSIDIEHEIVEALNRQTALLNNLVALVNNLVKEKTIEQDWYDAYDTMRILKISKRGISRLQHHHPELCKKIMGKWYYNLAILLMFKGKE